MINSSSAAPSQNTQLVEKTSTPRQHGARFSRVDVVSWGILLTSTLLLAVLMSVLSKNQAWDDAYISFRYSRNLANGDGLVWNPGGERTQGYTNFLFVVLVAAGMKLNLSPIFAASLLNTAGLVSIIIILGILSRTLMQEYRRAWLIPPLALLSLPSVSYHLRTGMETVFWTGLLLLAIYAAQRAVHTRRAAFSYFSLTLFLLAAFTRPETVMVAVPIGLYLLIEAPAHHRVHVMLAAALVGTAGLLYLYWANEYFGDFLPNPFYVKVDQPKMLPGWDYVAGLFRYFAVLPMTYPGLIGLLPILRRHRVIVRPYISVFALLVFYLFVTPMMSYGFRFLFPVMCVIDFLIMVGLVSLILRTHHWLFRSSAREKRMLQRAGATVLLAMMLAFFVLHVWMGGYLIWRNVQAVDSSRARDHQTTIGSLLHTVEGIEHVKVAFCDAGKVAYFSNSVFLDTVGLNENIIARSGNQQGADWVIRYVLDQQPDVIGFYTYADGGVHKSTDGALGPDYYALYIHADFKKDYSYAGGFISAWGSYAQLFIRTESPYATALLDVIRNKADTHELGTLHP